MIKITNLTKSYAGTPVLQDLSLAVGQGEIFGIAGRSGSGKSTLLRCINGLETFEGGSLRINGTDLRTLSKDELRFMRRDIGMIFQQFSLLTRLSVFENIALPMRCWKYSQRELADRVHHLLDVIGIPDKAQARSNALSGGQKQRVAIARALGMNPKIILCDEATSALDPQSTQSIIDLLKRINAELGITIIVVSHEMSVIRALCKNFAIIRNGRVEANGSVEQIFAEKPFALQDLTGAEKYLLPRHGHNIELLFSRHNQGDPLITRMARELDTDFTIIGGETEKYAEMAFNSIIVNIPPPSFECVRNYLDANSIAWREIEQAQPNLPHHQEQ